MTAHLIFNLFEINCVYLNNLALFNTNLIIYLIVFYKRCHICTTIRKLATLFTLRIRSKHCKSKIFSKSKSYLFEWYFCFDWFDVFLNQQIYCLFWLFHFEFFKKSLYSILLLFCFYVFQKFILFNLKLF